MALDPYKTLGVSPTASDSELRSAYRRLVALHHPDHNGGSAESTRRFEEVQDAYSRVRALRAGSRPTATANRADGGSGTARGSSPGGRQTKPSAPELDAQLAEMERQLREAQAARARVMQDARVAAAPESERRASDEELGYVKSDDSFSKIFDDAISELSHWFEERRKPQR